MAPKNSTLLVDQLAEACQLLLAALKDEYAAPVPGESKGKLATAWIAADKALAKYRNQRGAT